jgi:hypothetical protein
MFKKQDAARSSNRNSPQLHEQSLTKGETESMNRLSTIHVEDTKNEVNRQNDNDKQDIYMRKMIQRSKERSPNRSTFQVTKQTGQNNVHDSMQFGRTPNNEMYKSIENFAAHRKRQSIISG